MAVEKGIPDYAAMLSTLEGTDPNDPMNHISASDYSEITDETGALRNETYFPGMEASPVNLQFQPGRYFAALPVVSGGQAIYPYGVRDARRKAIEQAAYRSQLEMDKKKKSVMNAFKMLKGEPQYQALLNDHYKREIFSQIDETFKKHGKNGASKLNDMSDPDTEALMEKYLEYESFTTGINEIKGTMTELIKEQSKGYVPSAKTWTLINKYYDGKMTVDDFKTMPQQLRSYQTLDKWVHDNRAVITKAVQTYYENGIPVKGKDGKETVLTSKAGSAFINEVKKQFLSGEQLDGIVKTIRYSGSIDPDTSDATIKEYLKSVMPEELEYNFHQITYPSNNSNTSKKKNLEYKSGSTINTNYGDEGDPNYKPFMSVGGFDMQDKQINLDIAAPSHAYDLNTNKQLTANEIGKASLNVDVVGVYDVWKDKQDGHLVSNDSKYLPGLQQKGLLKKTRMALVISTDQYGTQKQMLIPYANVASYLENDYNLSGDEDLAPVNTPEKPAQKASSGTTKFTIKGVTYNIPNDKVAAFKKAKGL
jgi:hypothetical protein